jgi:hypothetical protein
MDLEKDAKTDRFYNQNDFDAKSKNAWIGPGTIL